MAMREKEPDMAKKWMLLKRAMPFLPYRLIADIIVSLDWSKMTLDTGDHYYIGEKEHKDFDYSERDYEYEWRKMFWGEHDDTRVSCS